MLHQDKAKGRAASLAAADRQPVWLLLVHQLPTRPSNARVKTWRRLQKLGAVAVKNSVYVLPNSPQAREDFEWIKTEIAGMKGQATVFAAESVDALSGNELAGAFRTARQRDYDILRAEVERLLRRRSGQTRQARLRDRLEREAQLLRQRYAEIEAIDFFQAEGREEARAALGTLERMRKGGAWTACAQAGRRLRAADFQNRLWITRPGPGIDRMACAWLIRRCIDPRARFGFVHKSEQAAGAVPFDMFGVEFSHQGDTCSFETFLNRFGISGPAMESLARIVHELDLKDEKYASPEAGGVARLVDGLRRVYSDDRERLEQGMVVFEALYRSFAANSTAGRNARKPGGQRRLRVRRPRR